MILSHTRFSPLRGDYFMHFGPILVPAGPILVSFRSLLDPFPADIYSTHLDHHPARGSSSNHLPANPPIQPSPIQPMSQLIRPSSHLAANPPIQPSPSIPPVQPIHSNSLVLTIRTANKSPFPPSLILCQLTIGTSNQSPFLPSSIHSQLLSQSSHSRRPFRTSLTHSKLTCSIFRSLFVIARK